MIQENIFEGPCLLKTKTDRYKDHWAVLTGNEIYCYRNKDDQKNRVEQRIMHSLIGTFIKDLAAESSESEGCDLHPIKIILPPNKSRLLYFREKQ